MAIFDGRRAEWMAASSVMGVVPQRTWATVAGGVASPRSLLAVATGTTGSRLTHGVTAGELPHTMKRFTARWIFVGALLVPSAGNLLAAPFDDTADAALKQKTEEVNRLRQDLDKQEAELKRLKQENERLRKQKTPPPAASSASAQPATPVTPIASLPPLADGAIVEVVELTGHFNAEPAAAAERYAGKRLKVRGEIQRFSRGMVTRDYSIILTSGDPALTVICSFKYEDAYKSVYEKNHGAELAARTTSGSELAIARIGETVTVTGRCKGLKKGEIHFTGCETTR